MDKLIPKNKEQIIQAFQEFRKIKNEKSFEKIRAKYFELFGVFPMTVQFYETKYLKHMPIFRARPCAEVIKYGKENINSYMGPPIYQEVGNGRANWNGRNVFYSGDSPFCSIVENKKVEVGEEYFVGQWEIDVEKINHEQVLVAYLTHSNLSPDNPWNSILPSRDNMIDHFSKWTNIEESTLLVELMEELSTLFSEDDTEYNLSAFIADNFLYSKSYQAYTPEILIYPSNASEKNSCNIAIHPYFAQKYLRLRKVVKIQITESNYDEFKADFNSIGQMELGKIQFYHFNFDRGKAVYKIDVFGCGCGTKFRIKDPKKLMLENEDKSKMSLKDLLDKESPKWVKDDDLVSYSEGVFSNSGLATKKIIHVTIPLPKTLISRGGKEHNNLFCNIIIEQPFNYIKEGSTNYLSKSKKNLNY